MRYKAVTSSKCRAPFTVLTQYVWKTTVLVFPGSECLMCTSQHIQTLHEFTGTNEFPLKLSRVITETTGLIHYTFSPKSPYQ